MEVEEQRSVMIGKVSSNQSDGKTDQSLLVEVFCIQIEFTGSALIVRKMNTQFTIVGNFTLRRKLLKAKKITRSKKELMGE